MKSVSRVPALPIPTKNEDGTCALSGCEEQVPTKRHKWHSQECSDISFLERNWHGLKILAFAKTGGKCNHCNRELRMASTFGNFYFVGPSRDGLNFKAGSNMRKFLMRHLKPEQFPKGQKLSDNGKYLKAEIDHIKAIALGGSPNDINNLQPLCIKCHKKKTKKDIKKITAIRKMDDSNDEIKTWF